MNGSRDRKDFPIDMQADTVTRLLHLGTYGRLEPVEQLIERIGRPDGHDWFLQSLAEAPLRASGPREQQAVLKGKHSLDELFATKQESKRLMSQADAPETYLAALLHYFVTLALGLVHYHHRITGVPPEEVEAALLDLAEILPEPWSQLFSRAAVEAPRASDTR